jgi:hypothetical protein
VEARLGFCKPKPDLHSNERAISQGLIFSEEQDSSDYTTIFFTMTAIIWKNIRLFLKKLDYCEKIRLFEKKPDYCKIPIIVENI